MKHRRVSNRRVKQMLEELHTDEMHIISIDSNGEQHQLDARRGSGPDERRNLQLDSDNK